MRDRLIELLKKADKNASDKGITDYVDAIADNADYLLANGVIVPPCKVGNTAFLLLEKLRGGYDIVESKCVRICENEYIKVYSMAFDCAEIGNTLEYDHQDFGKWVFLTKEEAEAKLKGMQE
jgi:hypothetical protein